jgi:hypothetical protein
MSKHLGPIEVECDAPSYPVVQSSRRCGIVSPEDVRWTRLSRFLLERAAIGQGSLWGAPWNLFSARTHPAARTCSCGQPLPELRRVTFSFDTGVSLSYALGQCPCCRTVFWDEV